MNATFRNGKIYGKVAMRTWQGGDCECDMWFFFMFAAEQLSMIFLWYIDTCMSLYTSVCILATYQSFMHLPISLILNIIRK